MFYEQIVMIVYIYVIISYLLSFISCLWKLFLRTYNAYACFLFFFLWSVQHLMICLEIYWFLSLTASAKKSWIYHIICTTKHNSEKSLCILYLQHRINITVGKAKILSSKIDLWNCLWSGSITNILITLQIIVLLFCGEIWETMHRN